MRCQNMKQTWKHEQVNWFKDCLGWYNNKDVVPNLEALQKVISPYHDKDINNLNLGCTLPNLANICAHTTADAKLYAFKEGDRDLFEKIHQDAVGVSFIVFTREAVVDQTFIRKSTHICKSIAGINMSNHADWFLYALGSRINDM